MLEREEEFLVDSIYDVIDAMGWYFMYSIYWSIDLKNSFNVFVDFNQNSCKFRLVMTKHMTVTN